MEGRYNLGIDGGGTATEFCAQDPDGRLLFAGRAGAINLNGARKQDIGQVFLDVREGLQGQGLFPGNCLQIGFGAAGISNPSSKEIYEEALLAAGFSCPVSFFGDQMSALAAAFASCRGVVLIAGTGSICCGVDREGKSARTGGWGHLVDDRGSAYAIAQQMCAAIFRARDGRAEKTCLGELVLQKLQLKDLDELIGWLYWPERGKRDLAALAVLADQAAEDGDEAALRIEEQAAKDLLELAGGVLRELPSERTVALRGGVLLGSARIREELARLLKKEYRAESFLSRESAAVGALNLLRLENANKGDRKI